MGGKIPEIKLTAQCLVHCAVYYYLYFIGTIIINHVWFQIKVFEASYSMCVFILCLLPCQQGCFKGCISKCVLKSSPVLGEVTLASTSSLPQELISMTITHGSLKMLHKWCTLWKLH